MKKILLITALASLSACGGSSGGSDGNSQVLGTSPISLQNRQFKVSQSDFVTDCPRPARSLFTSIDLAQLAQAGLYRMEFYKKDGTVYETCSQSFYNSVESSALGFSPQTDYSTVANLREYITLTFTSPQPDDHIAIKKAEFDAALKNHQIVHHEQVFNKNFELEQQSFWVKQENNKLTRYSYFAPDVYAIQHGSATQIPNNAQLKDGVLIGKEGDAEIKIYKIQ